MYNCSTIFTFSLGGFFGGVGEAGFGNGGQTTLEPEAEMCGGQQAYAPGGHGTFMVKSEDQLIIEVASLAAHLVFLIRSSRRQHVNTARSKGFIYNQALRGRVTICQGKKQNRGRRRRRRSRRSRSSRSAQPSPAQQTGTQHGDATQRRPELLLQPARAFIIITVQLDTTEALPGLTTCFPEPLGYQIHRSSSYLSSRTPQARHPQPLSIPFQRRSTLLPWSGPRYPHHQTKHEHHHYSICGGPCHAGEEARQVQ